MDVYGDPDGPAIVLIPGVLSDAAAWRPVAAASAAWPTVAVVNRRGRHPSGPLPADYTIATEIADATAVLHEFTDVRTLFGWSYGGLIALHLATTIPIPQVIAYEPVTAPFGATALPDLRRAHESGDADARIEVALRQVAGMPTEEIAALRAKEEIWSGMRRLGTPVHAETRAINEAPQLTEPACRVDLIVGEHNRDPGSAPYGTSFHAVARHLPHATVHQLDDCGHLAHLTAPAHLAALLDDLSRRPGRRGPAVI